MNKLKEGSLKASVFRRQLLESRRRTNLAGAFAAAKAISLSGMEARKPHEHFNALKGSYADNEGRITDRGAGLGLTAYDLYLLEKIKQPKQYLVISITLALALTIILIMVKGVARSFGDLLMTSWSALLSTASVFLTFGLLAVTWRYANLTQHIVQEMRETRAREYEPQLVVYVKPWLAINDKDEAESTITIRNYGRVPALAVSLSCDHCFSRSASSFEVTAVVKPSEEKNFDISFSKNEIQEYTDSSGKPSASIRISYLDNQANTYTLTQDYILKREQPPRLVFQM